MEKRRGRDRRWVSASVQQALAQKKILMSFHGSQEVKAAAGESPSGRFLIDCI